jgi:hypothetical protein
LPPERHCGAGFGNGGTRNATGVDCTIELVVFPNFKISSSAASAARRASIGSALQC